MGMRYGPLNLAGCLAHIKSMSTRRGSTIVSIFSGSRLLIITGSSVMEGGMEKAIACKGERLSFTKQGKPYTLRCVAATRQFKQICCASVRYWRSIILYNYPGLGA